MIEERGRGGFAKVFLAFHETIHDGVPARVALKWVDPRKPEGDLPARNQSLEREGEVLERLNHPNIVSLSYRGQERGRHYLVTELVNGNSLTDELSRTPAQALETHRARTILDQVLAALEAAHAEDVIHRDLSPGNIMIHMGGGGECVKVIDFGIAKDLTRGSTNTELAGNPRYMAPEQFTTERKVGPWTDIFSLGVVAYRLLTGREAYQADHAGALYERQNTNPFAALDGSEVRGPTLDFLRTCMKFEASERFQTAAEARAALERAFGNREFLRPPESNGPGPSRRRFATAVVVTILGVAGAVGLWLAVREAPPPDPPGSPPQIADASMRLTDGTPVRDATGLTSDAEGTAHGVDGGAEDRPDAGRSQRDGVQRRDSVTDRAAGPREQAATETPDPKEGKAKRPRPDLGPAPEAEGPVKASSSGPDKRRGGPKRKTRKKLDDAEWANLESAARALYREAAYAHKLAVDESEETTAPDDERNLAAELKWGLENRDPRRLRIACGAKSAESQTSAKVREFRRRRRRICKQIPTRLLTP